MKKITLETISNLNQSAIMELFYNEFLAYGKKCSLYIAHNHDMTIEYCTNYIASGLFELFLSRCEKLHENEEGYNFSRETMLYSFLGTKKLVKKIMAVTNYSSYFKNNVKAYENGNETIYKLPAFKKSKNKFSEFRNVKKVNSSTIDIVDVLEQKENRTSKKLLSLDNELFEGVSISNTIASYYPTPEQDLLNKLSRVYSVQFAKKIRSDKKFYKIVELENKINNDETLLQKDYDFIKRFKERYNMEVLNFKEILYIVNNY